MAYRLSIPTIPQVKPIGGDIFKSQIGLGSGMSGVKFWEPPKGPTPQQLLTLAKAKDKHHRTFGDRLKGVGLGIAHPFEVALHQLLRTSTGVAEGVRRGNKVGRGLPRLEQFIHGFGYGFHHPGTTAFSDVLKEDPTVGHYFRKHKVQAGIAGLALDVTTDPLTYLTLGTSVTARAGGQAAFQAGKVAIESGAKAEHIPQLKSAANTLEKAGEGYQKRAALARARVKALEAELNTARNAGSEAKELRQAAAFTLENVAEPAAVAEELAHSARTIKIGFRAGKLKVSTPTHIRGVRVAPNLPRVGEKLAASRIPIVAPIAGGMRKHFGAGSTDWERKLRVARKHVVEERADSFKITAGRYAKAMPKLNKKEALYAWHLYESPGLIRKTVDGYALDGRKAMALVRKGKLSKKQYNFLIQWDKFANFMWRMDKAAGIEVSHIFEKTGGGYVPHLMERNLEGVPVKNDYVRQFLKQAGYTKKRRKDLTLSFLNHLHEKGSLPEKLEIDPYTLMIKMGRQRANAHADRAVYHFLTDAYGVPARIVEKPVDQKKLKTIQSRLDEIESKLTGKSVPRKGETNAKLEGKRAYWERQLDSASKPKMKKNPEAGGDLVTLKSPVTGKTILNADGQAVKVEQEAADALNRYERILSSSREMSNFATAWQRAMGRWKVLVTAVNIGGYRIRNTLSDFWNMYLNGVPVRSMPHAATLATQFMVKVQRGDMNSLREFMHLYHSGALSGVFGGDVSLLSKELETGRGGPMVYARKGRLLKAASRAAQDVNREAENWGRLTHYFYRTRIEGLSRARAVQHVRQAHFDYEDLTKAEQAIKSKFIPFYTWTRKDVPYQIQMFVEHPGRYATFPKTVVESEKATETQGDLTPGYLGNNLAFKVPGLGYLTPQIGAADVARFQNPKEALRSLVTMQNPALKAVAELGLNKQFYTGQPIKDPKGHSRVPVSTWLAPLLGLVPGADVGTTTRMVGGKPVEGVGANPYAMYFVNQLPLTRYLGNSFNPITRGKRGYAPELSYLLGLSTTKMDKKQQLIMEQLALSEEIAAMVKKMRDEGRYPRAKRKVSANQQKILDQLQQSLGRP